MVELDRFADQAEAGTVDDVLRLEAVRGEFRLDPPGCVGLGEVDRQYQRPSASGRGDFVGKGI